MQAILSHVDPAKLNLWKLFDEDTLPTWIRSRHLSWLTQLILSSLGSAREAAMAIEDAASITAMLPSDIRRDEVYQRLRLYGQCRRPRATKLQEMTRMSVSDTDEETAAHLENAMAATAYAFGYDGVG